MQPCVPAPDTSANANAVCRRSGSSIRRACLASARSQHQLPRKRPSLCRLRAATETRMVRIFWARARRIREEFVLGETERVGVSARCHRDAQTRKTSCAQTSLRANDKFARKLGDVRAQTSARHCGVKASLMQATNLLCAGTSQRSATSGAAKMRQRDYF